MALRILLETGNDAFADDRGAEVARILRELANHFDQTLQSAAAVRHLVDANGNRVGLVSDELDD